MKRNLKDYQSYINEQEDDEIEDSEKTSEFSDCLPSLKKVKKWNTLANCTSVV